MEGGTYNPRTLKMRWKLMLSIQSEITRTKNDALSSISKYKSSIHGGETTLETLASKISDCSSARKKGDLCVYPLLPIPGCSNCVCILSGYFGRGEMQEAFESAAYSLKVGEMSDVIETESGLHLIKRCVLLEAFPWETFSQIARLG